MPENIGKGYHCSFSNLCNWPTLRNKGGSSREDLTLSISSEHSRYCSGILLLGYLTEKESDIETEEWECTFCGKQAPCKVQIAYSESKLPSKLRGKRRFINMVCLCGCEATPLWVRSQDKKNGDGGNI